MKVKKIFAALGMICILCACSGPKSDADADPESDLNDGAGKIPGAVKKAFKKTYPGASANWENEDGKFEASFTWNQETRSAIFNKDGSLQEAEIDMKPADLPQKIKDHMKTYYTKDSIKEAARITLANGATEYEAAIEGKDVLFNSNGDFLREIKDQQ